jgi:hypothetical protein
MSAWPGERPTDFARWVMSRLEKPDPADEYAEYAEPGADGEVSFDGRAETASFSVIMSGGARWRIDVTELDPDDHYSRLGDTRSRGLQARPLSAGDHNTPPGSAPPAAAPLQIIRGFSAVPAADPGPERWHGWWRLTLRGGSRQRRKLSLEYSSESYFSQVKSASYA